ncbi:MAG: hypothetical protein P0Y65_05625 [Candidatus Devosia phytovorans]|uniref:Uncharacterized protein n=1 Tax=Candidatus Devosia phytovorans TaxID=3121372 RepID=A0AAJ5VYD9_9HYPH|nr:hypothetical protein [Devosia sp.]WEK05734.1 MAG: hypothetical protein P0Y65_05625 [Devosia sp.]
MRDVTHFVVVFPTRLMAASYDEKKAIMDALRREYPHYEFDALEAFEGGMADDDDFDIIPVVGSVGEEGDSAEVILSRPLDPLVIPDLLRAISHAEQLPQAMH